MAGPLHADDFFNFLPNQLEHRDVINKVANWNFRQGNAQPEEIFADLFRLP